MALEFEDFEESGKLLNRALERDPKSLKAWELRARLAEVMEDEDELIYALHRLYRLSRAQKIPKSELTAIRARLEVVDPIAPDLLDLKLVFVDKLVPLATFYEKQGRPHSAIRIHNEILALDPERLESDDAIQRIASAPDPSLAESARPRDLLAEVSEEWIRSSTPRTTRGRTAPS